MSAVSVSTATPLAPTSSRPPVWLILATSALALTILALAVAETDLTAHYLIDAGDYVSLFGLGFILLAGVALYRRSRLYVSLPLVFPWLLYPVITQGDQLIDNLAIGPMRLICHVLLAAIFGTPVMAAVLGARHLLAPRSDGRTVGRGWTRFFLALVPGLRPLAEGRTREGTTLLAAALLAAEIWLADQYLGSLMIGTLIVMILGVLVYGSWPASHSGDEAVRRVQAERVAFAVLIVGVGTSLAAYVGYKNAPGAYQGSPSFFMDPAQKDAAYRLDRITVPEIGRAHV